MLGKFIKHCEDSLTAAVFTNLFHLESREVWGILRRACNGSTLPGCPGSLLEVECWPVWSGEGTGNTSRVIPDLFTRWDELDLIIEAKRWDATMQDPDQWSREFTAYLNEFGGEEKPVRMVAVGTLVSDVDGVAIDKRNRGGGRVHCAVHKCTWRGILDECQRLASSASLEKNVEPAEQARLRVLRDIIDLFAWHGFSTGMWFRDFDFNRHRLSAELEMHHRFFQKRFKEVKTS